MNLSLKEKHLISWNANGLSPHLPELLYFLDKVKIKPHFICIQETWIYEDKLPPIANYNFVHTYRNNKKGGGSAIYIHENIEYCNIDLSHFNDTNIEVSGINFKTVDNDCITLLSVYIAPMLKIDLDQLNKLISNKKIIILGDFNAKNKLWGSKLNDSRGKIIEQFLEINSLICLNRDGTRINYNGTLSHLDLALCSTKLGLDLNCEVLEDSWGSDHYPLSLSCGINYPKITLSNVSKLNYNKADWNVFKHILNINPSFHRPITNVNEAYESLVISYTEAAKASIPTKKGPFKHKYTPFWNQECSTWKENRKLAEKALRRAKTPENQINFKKCRAKFRYVVNEAKTIYWERYCSRLKYNSKIGDVWNTVKKLKGADISTKIHLINNKGFPYDNKDTADVFAEIFKEISSDKNLSSTLLDNRKATVDNYFKTLNVPRTDSKSHIVEDSNKINDIFKLCELELALKNVNTKSAPGVDEIPYIYLINSPNLVKKYFLDLLNKSWLTSEIPVKWKHSIIKPILKPSKNKNDPNSYRPISLTNTTSKIMEKMIVNRLNWYLEKNNLFNSNQAGFRKFCSTSDPIIRLKQEADHALMSGNITVAIMLDFSRAFDLLWVDGLLLKMMNLNITGCMLKWIRCFLTDRKYQVKIGNDYSFTYSTENGTPQGSAISPVLFLLMINDFPKLSCNTSEAFFADDSTIWRSGNNLLQIVYHLQKDLEDIEVWCKKWGFMINTDKTVGIVFTNKKIDNDAVKLQINGKQINFKNDCKLLGVIFDKHLTWSPHIDYIIDKVKPRLNLMRCISGTKWGASKSILLTLYKALIRSIIDYCCFVYNDSAKSITQKIDSLQYKSLLIATGGMRGTALKALLGECGEIPLALRRKQILLTYLIKINNNSNNSASLVLFDKKYYHLQYKGISIYKTILNGFLDEIKIVKKIFGLSLSMSPWSCFYDQVDLSLLSKFASNNYGNCLNIDMYFDELIENNKYIIFVDGSVRNDGKVGAAIYSPNIPLDLIFRLPDGLSIYYAEAFAILQALLYVFEHDLHNVFIYSDCSHVLNDLKVGNFEKSTHPSVILDICHALNSVSSKNIGLVWLPKHYNYIGSQIVDLNAKHAITLTNIHNIKYTFNEVKDLIEEWTLKKWHDDWGRNPSCSYQKYFLPHRGFQIAKNLPRNRETIINRLRMMQSHLKGGLLKINKHEDGMCRTCNTVQDNFHFLMSCKDTEELRRTIKRSVQNETTWSFQDLLSSRDSLSAITDFIINNKIDI